jgi:hypothetical protein
MEGFMAGLFGRVEADTNGAVDDAQEMMCHRSCNSPQKWALKIP